MHWHNYVSVHAGKNADAYRYDKIMKKSTNLMNEGANILLVHSVLGMCFKIDVEKQELVEKIYLR